MSYYPAPIQIVRAIERRLANISTANGYFSNAPRIERVEKTFDTGPDLPLIQIGLTSVSKERDAYGNDLVTVGYGMVIKDSAGDVNPSFLAAKIIADVETALNRATTAPTPTGADSVDLGGLVESLTVATADASIGSDQVPAVYVTMDIDVKYHAPYGDAFTVQGGWASASGVRETI